MTHETIAQLHKAGFPFIEVSSEKRTIGTDEAYTTHTFENRAYYEPSVSQLIRSCGYSISKEELARLYIMLKV